MTCIKLTGPSGKSTQIPFLCERQGPGHFLLTELISEYLWNKLQVFWTWMSHYNGLPKNKNKQESHNGLDIINGDGSLVSKSCPTLCNTMDCSPPGSSVQGISQVRLLEWVAISFSRGSFLPRDWTQVSGIAGRVFTDWATREAPGKWWSGLIKELICN